MDPSPVVPSITAPSVPTVLIYKCQDTYETAKINEHIMEYSPEHFAPLKKAYMARAKRQIP